MNSKDKQSVADSLNYWDARVTRLDCNYFADEIEMEYRGDDSVITYSFLGCYKSNFNHVKDYDKIRPVKKMSDAQIPYFLHDIEIGEIVDQGIDFYTCRINMFPLELDVWCKDIIISSTKVELKCPL